MLNFSTRRMASILGEPQTKARRWVKEFLPPDPDKGLRSGRTRRHSLNEVFHVYLGGHLVTRMDFSVLEARTILKDLALWMEREGLYPEKTVKYAPKDHDGESLGIARYDIHIMPTMIPLAFCYECRGLIRKQTGKNRVVRSEYVVDSFFGSGQPVQMSPVIDHVRILPISGLSYRFKTLLSYSNKPRQATTKPKGHRPENEAILR
jgi:hypothetical protein